MAIRDVHLRRLDPYNLLRILEHNIKTFFHRVSLGLEMARTVGLGPTATRIRLFARSRLAAHQRKRQFRRLNLQSPVVRDILGNQMLLDPSLPGLDRDLLLNGIREPIATGRIMRILQPDDIVLEIGANIGYYALIEARICRKVYAAEPHPKNFERLRKNIALNGKTNVEMFNIALGAVDATIHLACSPLSNWHTCRNATAQVADVIEVPGRRIDSFVADKEPPTFIKMDVEGYELEVLRGATETLRNIRAMFLELHGDTLSHDEIIELLDILSASGLSPSLIVQYDWPGMSLVYPLQHIEAIRAGDRGTYELFFERISPASS